MHCHCHMISRYAGDVADPGAGCGALCRERRSIEKKFDPQVIAGLYSRGFQLHENSAGSLKKNNRDYFGRIKNDAMITPIAGPSAGIQLICPFTRILNRAPVANATTPNTNEYQIFSIGIITLHVTLTIFPRYGYTPGNRLYHHFFQCTNRADVPGCPCHRFSYHVGF